jgi:hypothetical protein
MIRPSTATHIVFAILLILFMVFAVPYLGASAQADPEPTPECWEIDGQPVCLGPGPVATTATPTVTPTPTPEETPEIRPMNICAHPLFTCVRLPIVFGLTVTGGVQ